ncbi:hypothetical protein ACHAWF_002595 [Thalassiosira exigua]
MSFWYEQSWRDRARIEEARARSWRRWQHGAVAVRRRQRCAAQSCCSNPGAKRGRGSNDRTFEHETMTRKIAPDDAAPRDAAEPGAGAADGTTTDAPTHPAPTLAPTAVRRRSWTKRLLPSQHRKASHPFQPARGMRPYLNFVPLLLAASSLVARPAVAATFRIDGGPSGWDVGAWRAQVDGVMGGQSSGDLSFVSSDAVLKFAGDVVLEGGGFSSVRRRFDVPLDLTPYAGVVVALEATEAYDGKAPLGMHLQFGDAVSRYWGFASAFAVPLTSSSGEETSVYLPLESFDRGSRMGWQCDDCAIDFSSTDEMDLYVLFQGGEFDVRVKEIYAVEDPVRFPSPVVSFSSAEDLKSLVDSTVSSGGSLYDKGYSELCIAIYRSVLNSVLASDSTTVASDDMKNMICQGLQRAETQASKVDVAWTLRYTLDAILEELGYAASAGASAWRPDVARSFDYQCSGVTSGAYVRAATGGPTMSPTTAPPTPAPSFADVTNAPTSNPTAKTRLTDEPTAQPMQMAEPMPIPTIEPTSGPTTAVPVMSPSSGPTAMPMTSAPSRTDSIDDQTGSSVVSTVASSSTELSTSGRVDTEASSASELSTVERADVAADAVDEPVLAKGFDESTKMIASRATLSSCAGLSVTISMLAWVMSSSA